MNVCYGRVALSANIKVKGITWTSETRKSGGVGDWGGGLGGEKQIFVCMVLSTCMTYCVSCPVPMFHSVTCRSLEPV